jgi:molybdate transport system substrate-binding protein
MFRDEMLKILLQQYLPTADLRFEYWASRLRSGTLAFVSDREGPMNVSNPTLWRVLVTVEVTIAQVLALMLLTVQAVSADLRVFSGAAPQSVLRDLALEFERATGHRANFTFRLVTEIQQKLAAGEQADLIMLPVPLLAATEKSIALRTEGRIALARMVAGVIVREGTEPPDISTPEALRKMLLNARTIAWDDPNTPLGSHFNRMILQLGIADEVRPKVIGKAPIHGGADLVAKGEADVGLFLVSEVQTLKGIKLVGSLPSPLQFTIVYGTAVPAYNAEPEPALAFVKFISDPSKTERWKAGGFEPVGAP